VSFSSVRTGFFRIGSDYYLDVQSETDPSFQDRPEIIGNIYENPELLSSS